MKANWHKLVLREGTSRDICVVQSMMGSSTSIFDCNNGDDDVHNVEYDGSQGGGGGVIKRIPIEVKPRGKLGLRSVRSLSKPKVNNERFRWLINGTVKFAFLVLVSSVYQLTITVLN